MATIPVNYAPEIQGLQICLSNTLEQINCALDRGDRRAFRIWTDRHRSLSERLASLLLKLATSN